MVTKMPEMWKPQPIEVYISWCEAILDEAESKLNDWERDFIDTISIKLYGKSNLTQRQAEVLERIYTEKTS